MTREQAEEAVDGLAAWSDWAPFADVAATAPRLPGVYLFRLPTTRQVVYAGMAGERPGSRNSPQGLRGRLTVYRRGKGAVSGFGEAALDRALADPAWIEARLASLRSHGPERAKLWAAAAIERLAPEVRWAVTPTAADAGRLEDRVVALLGPHGLWNRARAAPGIGAVPVGGGGADAGPDPVIEVRGHRVDVDVLYREMHRHSAVGPDGTRVFAGNALGVPAVKRLLHALFGVPVSDGIDPVNDAVRRAARDRLRDLGWATKDSGRSGKYVLHREP